MHLDGVEKQTKLIHENRSLDRGYTWGDWKGAGGVFLGAANVLFPHLGSGYMDGFVM